MSTKIFNGIEFDVDGLDELHRRMTALRPAVAEVQSRGEATFIAATAAAEHDRRLLDDPDGEHSASPFSHAVQEFWRRKREIVSSGRRDVEVDWELKVSVLPFEGRYFGMHFAERSALSELLLDQAWVREFRYWDSSEGPDDIDDGAWAQRGEVWGRLFDRSGSPAQCGFEYDLSSGLALPDRKLIMALMPSIATRARSIARSRIVSRVLEEARSKVSDEEWKRDCLGISFRAMDFLGSGRGEALVADETLVVTALLPEILDEGRLKA